MSLSIKNCQILDENGDLITTNIYCENGKIKQIGDFLKAEEVIYANNNLLLPGLIDCHVHLREPGATHKEDFLSGGQAAAHGGVTTIFEMPNTNPPTTTIQALDEKRKLAKKCPVNCYSYFGATRDNLQEIKSLNKSKDAIGVKVYLGSSTGNLLVDDYDYLKELLNTYQGIVAIHAEDEEIILANAEKHKNIHDTKIHSEIRSSQAAEKAVKEALNALKKSNGRLYITHLSTKEEVELVKKAKKENLQVYAEVTPHHLFLTKASYQSKGNLVKMNPPLRGALDHTALWKALREGIIDTIATDHAPHLISEKEQDYWQAPAGVPGLETMLPLLLNASRHNQISLKQITELCSKNPAKIFGLETKGEIKEGFDADLTLVDQNLEKEVNYKNLVTKCSWSPFKGWKLKGWPVATVVGGKIVFKEQWL